MKYILISTILFLSCNLSESNKLGEENYSKFKVAVSHDSLSVFAEEYAKNVVMFHDDDSKVLEAEKWLDKRKSYVRAREASLLIKDHNDKMLLESSFSVVENLYVKTGCNYYQGHILIKPLTNNKDSLLKATKIFTDKTFLAIPYEGDCSGNPTKCLLFFYSKRSDFELTGQRLWILRGSRMTGEEAKVQDMQYY